MKLNSPKKRFILENSQLLFIYILLDPSENGFISWICSIILKINLEEKVKINGTHIVNSEDMYLLHVNILLA